MDLGFNLALKLIVYPRLKPNFLAVAASGLPGLGLWLLTSEACCVMLLFTTTGAIMSKGVWRLTRSVKIALTSLQRLSSSSSLSQYDHGTNEHLMLTSRTPSSSPSSINCGQAPDKGVSITTSVPAKRRRILEGHEVDVSPGISGLVQAEISQSVHMPHHH